MTTKTLSNIARFIVYRGLFLPSFPPLFHDPVHEEHETYMTERLFLRGALTLVSLARFMKGCVNTRK